MDRAVTHVRRSTSPAVGHPGGLAGRIRRAYRRTIQGRPVEASLVATSAYFVTLLVIRVVVLATRGTATDVSIDGVHIHHAVFGIIAVLIAGALSLDEVFRLPRAALFGFGAALILDEFALIVFLRDVYWLPQGVLSLVALAIGLAGLLVNAWRGRAFLRALGTAITDRVRDHG
jgi:hypothetical protein